MAWDLSIRSGEPAVVRLNQAVHGSIRARDPREVSEQETQEMIKRFLERRLSFADCIAALDAALAGLIPTLTGEQIARLRIVMLANNEIVMKEMETRRSLRPYRRVLRSGTCYRFAVINGGLFPSARRSHRPHR
jgi:hypothetical protein